MSIFEYFKRQIARGANDLDTMHKTVRSLGSSDNVFPLLKEVADNPNLVYGTESYAHYNGFDKLVFIDLREQGIALRLHIWWPYSGEVKHRENIHSHTFDLATTLLTGSYIAETYECADTGIAFHEYQYMRDVGADHYKLHLIGQTKLQKVSLSKLVAGSSYTQDASVIHRVIVPGDLTATLMLQRTRKDISARVFSENLIEEAESLVSSPFLTEQLGQKARLLLDALSH